MKWEKINFPPLIRVFTTSEIKNTKSGLTIHTDSLSYLFEYLPGEQCDSSLIIPGYDHKYVDVVS